MLTAEPVNHSPSIASKTGQKQTGDISENDKGANCAYAARRFVDGSGYCRHYRHGDDPGGKQDTELMTGLAGRGTATFKRPR